MFQCAQCLSRGMLSLLLFGTVVSAAERNIPLDPRTTESRLKKDLGFLASEKCEGRGPTTNGINLAADYIAEQFKQAGLMPLNKNGSYFQYFTIRGSTLKEEASISLRGPKGQSITLQQGVHFHPMGLSGSGAVKDVGLVFAGYGITGSQRFNYDDYADVKVAGKIVVLIRDTPRSDNPQANIDGQRRRRHASFTQKVLLAEKNDAVAVIIVNDAPTAKAGDDLLDFNFTATARSSAKIPVFHMKRAVLNSMFQASFAKTLSSVEQAIDKDLEPQSALLTGWTASVSAQVRRDGITVKNVVGTLEGAGPIANEAIVVGAHYDHLGYGGTSSLARVKRMTIHYGADDNASGTTAMIELARRYGQMKNRQGRRLVFIAFSAEELGLLGSQYYCKNPLFSLTDTAAMVNLDMVGRLSDDPKTKKGKLQVHGTGTATTFDKLVDDLNKNYQFQISKRKSGFGPSDHSSFYQKKVPVLFYFTGTHANYHRPSDIPRRVNYKGMLKILGMVQETIDHLRGSDRPVFVEVKAPTRRPGRGPRLGFRPGYGDDKQGVLVEGVISGLPAANAGIKAGDRIVNINGKEVKSLEGYMIVMREQKLGTTITVEVLREKKLKKLKVKLE